MFFRGAAHQQMAEAGATVGRDDDEVGVDFPRYLENAIEGEALPDDTVRRKLGWNLGIADLFEPCLNGRNAVLAEGAGGRENPTDRAAD